MPGYPKWSLSLRFPHQNPVYASPLPHMPYMPLPSNSRHFFTQIILSEEYRSLSSSLSSFLHSLVTSTLSSPNILLYTNTLSLHYSQVSHLYKTGKSIVLQIFTFKFLDSNLEDKYSALNDSKHSLTSVCS